MYCGACGKQLPDNAAFCSGCGTKTGNIQKCEETVLYPDTQVSSPAPLISEEEEVLLRALVGPNANYYLTEFKKLEQGMLSSNTAALYFKFPHALYRKAYDPLKNFIKRYAVVAAIVAVIVGILLILALLFQNPVIALVAVLPVIIASMVWRHGLWTSFNQQYLAQLRNIIATHGLTVDNINSTDGQRIIRDKGGVSNKNLVLSAAAVFVLVMLLAVTATVTGPFFANLSFGIGSNVHVRELKESELLDYPGVTIGKAFDNFISGAEWESYISEDGETVVNVSGEILYMDKPVNVLIQFLWLDDDYFEIYAVEFNGIPQDQFMELALLEKIYEDY